MTITEQKRKLAESFERLIPGSIIKEKTADEQRQELFVSISEVEAKQRERFEKERKAHKRYFALKLVSTFLILIPLAFSMFTTDKDTRFILGLTTVIFLFVFVICTPFDDILKQITGYEESKCDKPKEEERDRFIDDYDEEYMDDEDNDNEI